MKDALTFFGLIAIAGVILVVGFCGQPINVTVQPAPVTICHNEPTPAEDFVIDPEVACPSEELPEPHEHSVKKGCKR